MEHLSRRAFGPPGPASRQVPGDSLLAVPLPPMEDGPHEFRWLGRVESAAEPGSVVPVDWLSDWRQPAGAEAVIDLPLPAGASRIRVEFMVVPP